MAETNYKHAIPRIKKKPQQIKLLDSALSAKAAPFT